MTVEQPDIDQDADDGFDHPEPEKEGDDSELSERYGDLNHEPS